MHPFFRSSSALSTVLCLAAGCGGSLGNPLTSSTEPTGVQEAFGDVDCSRVKAQEAPDLMGWDSAARANLDRMRREGMVAVRYVQNGCDVRLDLLPNCRVKVGRGKRTYAWSPYSANETKIAHTQAELFAKLPLGAVSLAGRMAGERSLRTDYMLVGTRAMEVGRSIDTDQLAESEDCSKATHVITTIYYGGFALASAASKEVEASVTAFGAGAGGASKTSQELLANEGNADACRKAQTTGEEQPTCNVPLRVNLAPIAGRSTMASSSDVAAADGGAAGRFDGHCDPGMVPVAPGSFRFGPRKEPASVAGFCIDTTEVTAAAFLSCVEAGKCPPPSKSNPGCNFRDGARADHPMNCVNFDEALRYCSAQGKRLPTDREWEYAAVGHDGRAFPWGDDDPAGKACFDRASEGTCAVGTFPAGKGPFGALDLAGNVSEWTSTAESGDRYVRGGAYDDRQARRLESSLHDRRRRAEASERDVGFRCAK